MEEELQKYEQERKDWHSGFAGGLELSFRRFKRMLNFEREHSLSKEPLRIDFLIIKKIDDCPINNAVGRIFRKYNIVEYKNPYDELDIDVVWKAIGYAGLYKSFGKKVDEIPISEISISIFRSSKPVKLLQKLKSEGNIIEESYSGVYYVSGLSIIPLQIIVTSELDEQDFIAIKILRENADFKDAERFIKEIKYYEDQDDKENANAVLHLFRMANKTLIDEMRGENDMVYEAFRDVYEELITEAKAEGEAKGEASGEAKGEKRQRETDLKIFIEDKIEDGVPTEKIAAKLVKLYGFTETVAKEYVEKYTPVSAEK
ncbi:hypothetical protein [Butyrivibrio sp. YAB3001]|uniref:hypothetical protein n=1 Tax=Butyrivibrio sp. YAB3001 TaxID=1520812 RepID=UPI0008F68380|nr:hypothetical protein [Butyrivibrio sp. YAB3001]SFC59505.1 hypothetical protein SAMN02910398_02625 [Butyrivibrio sp. YAB3001]